MSLAALIEDRALDSPEAPAILAPGRRPLTFAALHAQVEHVARQLASWDIGPGAGVAIVLPNGPEMVTAFLATAAFAASAPLNPAHRRAEFEFYLEDLDPAVLLVLRDSDSPAVAVASDRGIPLLELAVDPLDPAGVFTLTVEGRPLDEHGPVEIAALDDIALILHTSGTTSRQKMVTLSQRNLVRSAANIRETLELTPVDRCLNVMPLFHIHGLAASVLASVAGGASVVATPGFDAARFYEWLDEFAPTWTTAVPTMHQGPLARADRHADLIARRPLRFIRSCSASLPPTVMADLEATFSAPVVEAYGMTEAAHQMTCNPLPPRKRKSGSVGPAAGPEVAIMDSAGGFLPIEEKGEVVIRGEDVASGYANGPEANAGAFTDGWFRTGDEGYLDGDGYLFLTGRFKEMINRAGEKISPREIDEVLLSHPAIAQALTFAVPDPRVGEEIAAALVLAKGVPYDERELLAYAADVETSDGIAPIGLAAGAEGPTTLAQDMLWLTGRLRPGTLANHRPGAVDIEGPLDLDRLADALTTLRTRHPALRTRLPTRGSRPVTVVDAPAPVELERMDVTGDEAGEEEFTREFIRRRFDLENGPLARFGVVRRDRRTHRLLLSAHHGIFDAWSMSVLVRELADLLGERELPPAPAISPVDVAAWERRRETRGGFDDGLQLWHRRLENISPMSLPIRTGADPDSTDEDGAAVRVTIARDAAERIDPGDGKWVSRRS